MKSKKPSLYDAQEEQIQLQSASFVDFLTRKGVLEDHNIDNERVRKAKKDTAQRAYHNTEVLLSQYRLIIWVLECIPGELSDELEVPVHDIDALAEKIDITPANLSILKTGKAKAIRFSTLEAICKVLDCQPADILEYQEEICD